MTDTPNGYRALPWHSDGYRVFDADGIEVANTYTPDLALGSAKAVAKDIVAAVNAHYGDTEAAEADLSYYKTASKNFEDSYWEANKRAEKAEARLKEVDSDRWGLLNRAEDAEARVRELEAENARLERALRDEISKEARQVFGVDDAPDTFTAPDGRVFRVGQRVKGVLSGLFSTIVGVNGNGLITKYKSGIANTGVPAENLRRVWDGTEEPGVPVGTVLRDSYGCYLERLSGTRWELQNEKGDPLDNDEWINLDGEQFRPYVEVLPGDDE